MDATLNLKTLLSKAAPLSTKIPYGFGEKDSILFELSYIDPQALSRIRVQAKTVSFVKHQHTESVDDDIFRENLIKVGIKNWSRLTYRGLLSLLPIDSQQLEDSLKSSGKSLDDEVPFTVENAVLLLKNTYGLETWILNSCTTVSNFRSERKPTEASTGN